MKRNSVLAQTTEKCAVLSKIMPVICAFLLVFTMFPTGVSYAETSEAEDQQGIVEVVEPLEDQSAIQDEAEDEEKEANTSEDLDSETSEDEAITTDVETYVDPSPEIASDPSATEADGSSGTAFALKSTRSTSVPTLAKKNTWYAGTTAITAFTTINIVDTYTADGSELESWDASSNQDGSIMAYVSADGTTLTIAGNGYGSILMPSDCRKAFSGFSAVTAINGIELLDMSKANLLDDMFYNCQSLVSLNLDDWDVSNVSSFRYTFDNCYALTSLGENNLKDWDTGSVAIFFGTFADCESLKAIDVSNWNLSACWNIDDMFARCKSLKSIDVSNWDVSYVSNMMCTFDTCVSLESIDVSKWDTSSAESMNGLFNNCKILKNIDVSGFDTSSCVNISLMFAGCERLTSIDVTGFDTSKVEDFQGVFDGCKSLTSIDVSTWDTSAGAEMSFLFDGCVGLTELSLGNFDTSACVDMACMFNGCTSLAKITGLSGWDTSSVEDMTWMFQDCTSIEALDLSAWGTSACTNLVGTFSKCSGLKVLDISGWDTSSAKYMSNFFSGCAKLQQVTLGEGFNFTGNGSTSCVLPTPDPAYIPKASGKWKAVGSGTVSNPAGNVYTPAEVPSNVAETYVAELLSEPVLAASDTWYKGSTAKSAIITINIVDAYTPGGSEIESWDASAKQDGSVMAYISANGTTLTIAGNGSGYIMANKDSDSAFKNFTSVTTISGTELLNTSKTTRMDGMFWNCEALEFLDLDSWDVSNVYMFSLFAENCYALTSFGDNNLRNWDTSSATHFSSFADNCESLTALDVSQWDVSKVQIANYMFSNCASLTELDVSQWKLSSVTQMAYTFEGCTGLKTLDLDNWTTSTATTMSGLFSGCAFTELDVTGLDLDSCTKIDNIFYKCSNLKTIKGINSWDTSSVELMLWAFYGCESIESLDLSNWTTPNMTSAGSAFSRCRNLKVLDISGMDTSNASVSNMFNYCIRLQQITLGENFTFNGKDDTRSVDLPTPDPQYIPGATGKWQAVGTGTVKDPQGEIYTPDAVPNNVAETYVMPKTVISIDVPVSVKIVCDSEGNWCTPSALENRIINHSTVPMRVASASTAPISDFTLLSASDAESSSTSNVFGGTIQPGDGGTQDLSSISCPAGEWTMGSGSNADGSNELALQLDGSLQNVSGHYFTAPLHVFDISYVFDTAS